ncbi:IS200/IS605 family element transposase accessory protein TnpB [Tissierella sp. MSJ-40]|uniref:IS200/IS605 family element transposase accessory protein TnpB n=1 Tax=Tissierella simiarum TaxID=2841534 RepID=A0ABS6EBP7_9FIRM|nr:IS200/IS605 family element RNA-guided endonuclease TnpB [Tissierella simiarum]MBU5440357.1 IS200/IS605 family element transposase accessory protein TnpB [Tissierella simiarum]
MLKAYKYRIYPNEKQKKQLAKTFGCVRFIYNYYLSMKKEIYETEKKSLSKIDCNNHLNQVLKKDNKYSWLKEVDKFSLTNSIYNLDTAYQNFFTEIKKGNNNQGYPRYKSKKNNYKSYKTNFTNNNIEVDFINNKIKLPKLKWIKAKVHREFHGKIKSATISKTPTNRYYVSMLVETQIEPLSQNNNKIGIDLGITDMLIDSNGNKIPNPKTLYKYEQKLTKEQRKLSKKERGSKNFHKQRIKVAKVHEKTTNIRKDYLHKLTFNIISENQVIITESLNVSGMIKNKNLSKAISDVSWSEFTRQLEYKSDWYKRTYHKIDPFYPSSQHCNNCGYKNQKTKNLSIRNWTCPECNKEHDRDINAAINILNQGLNELQIA